MHDGDDILIMHGWQPLVEGLGLEISSGIGESPKIRTDAKSHIEHRLEQLVSAQKIVQEESSRIEDLERRRAIPRIAAETDARQKGKSIAETEQAGRDAAEKIPDEGPRDSEALEAAEVLLDEHTVDGALWLVKKCSDCLLYTSPSPRD